MVVRLLQEITSWGYSKDSQIIEVFWIIKALDKSGFSVLLVA